MATIKNVAFTTNDLAAQQADIEQRRALAAALSQQQLPQSGFRSPLSPWAAALQEGASQFEMHQARKAEKALAEKSSMALADVLARASQAATGRPEIQQPAPEMGGGPGAPAIPPNRQAQIDALMGHPTTRGAAIQMMVEQPKIEAQERRFKDEQSFRSAERDAQRSWQEAQAEQARQDRLQREAEARKQQEAMARLQAGMRQPQVIQTAQGPMVIDEQGRAKPITDATGAPVKPAAGRGGPMTATAQKELIETEEQIQGGQAALSLFQQARAINDQAMGSPAAPYLATAGGLLPSALRPRSVEATQNLDNILQTAALPQLKAIFGGMPTEGERKILLDVQGSSSKPPKVRKEIFDRAEAAINARLKFGAEKAKRLREGTYFSGEGLPSIQPSDSLNADEQKELEALRKRFGR